jgi:hypothetical protein
MESIILPEMEWLRITKVKRLCAAFLNFSAPTTDPNLDREVAVMDSVVLDSSRNSFKSNGNQTEKEREKLIKYFILFPLLNSI